MQNAFKLVIAILASLLLTGTLVSATTAPAQAAVLNPVKVIQHNLDGGNTDYVHGKANDQGANIMTLQELCRTELNDLVALGWSDHGSYIVTKPTGCADGSDKGQAIMLRGPAVPTEAATQTELFNAGDNDGLGPNLGETGRSGFALTCFKDVNGLIGPWLTVCTTHLYTNPPTGVDGDARRETQANKVGDTINPWAQAPSGGRKVIFTGDLNMVPSSGSMDRFYNNFTEASGVRSGTSTHWTTDSRKIDYVFGDKSPAQASQSLALNAYAGSGHKVLKATITFNS